jgi:hypothetical protein
MLGVGGASAVIHYTPTVITSSSLTVGNGGAVVLMEPSGLITTVASNGAEDEDQQQQHHHHHHHHQADGGNDEASASNNGDHSPIHLPSTTFLNTHISKSVNNPFSIIVSCVLSFYYTEPRNLIPPHSTIAEELVCVVHYTDVDMLQSTFSLLSAARWIRFFGGRESVVRFDCTNWGN